MSSPPTKYVRVNGIMKLNPEFKKWKESQGGVGTTAPNFANALPVVTNEADYKELNHAVMVSGGGDETVPFAESTLATIEMMHEPDICLAAGMTVDTMEQQLGDLLNKYEVPIGLMNKLMLLSEFEYLEFLVDDSGSMRMATDSLNAYKQPQSRWQEAQSRLKEMMELLAHLPFNQIEVCFLNRLNRIVITRNGRDPQTLMQAMYREIDSVFAQPPAGTTPALEKLQESFQRGTGRSVARYFFGDGIPNGGQAAQERITALVKHRANPAMNPVTFLSCSNEDDQVEWMKDAEEVAPYCSESDDFGDEMREVIRDQGVALPFTKGFYLVGQLVAAMCPDDLDSMDESVPFTKTSLDHLLGIQHNVPTYRHYFDCFLQAQLQRVVERDAFGRAKASDNLKRSFNWRNHYNEFLTATVAKDIPAVQNFKAQLVQMDATWAASTSRGAGGPVGGDCCCIQ